MKSRYSYDLIVTGVSKVDKNALQKVTKLIIATLCVVIIVTIIIIGFLIKYTLPQSEGETDSEKSITEMDSMNISTTKAFDMTTEGMNLTTFNQIKNVTRIKSTYTSATQIPKGGLIH